MKIQLITSSKLKIMFNLKDLEENNISLHSFLSGSKNSIKFLKAIIEIAHEDFGFCIQDQEFSYETFYFNPSEFIIIVTPEKNIKNSVYNQNLEFYNTIENISRDSAISSVSSFNFVDNELSPSKTKVKNLFYFVSSFDDFLEISSYIKYHIKSFKLASFLYKYKNTFLLEIITSNLSNSELNQLIFIFSETKTNSISSKIAITRFKEFGELIISDNALNL